MKLICTLKKSPPGACVIAMLLINLAQGQVCSSPATTIYGMMVDGGIYPINTTTAAVGARINPAFTGNPAASANALGYNPNTKYFYFFKRNADQSPQEFVVYNSVSNTHTILASCPTTANIKTGAVNSTGTGYYCIDVNAN